VWSDETVEVPRWAQGAYAELFTGRTLELSAGAFALRDALATLPIAVLLRDGI
jgi:maltooligosyltrehalose synthase